ncbi:hypothetical protein QJS66_12545 [Kocuria rhizophila]|nr:hypothetical protein QJS66_12545 [Kocuria rhizophila]
MFTIRFEDVGRAGGRQALFMACDHWRRTRALEDLRARWSWRCPAVPEPRVAGHIADAPRYGAEAVLDARVESVDPETRPCAVTRGGARETVEYDALHVVPRTAPRGRGRGLADDGGAGRVAVEPTLRRVRFRTCGPWGIPPRWASSPGGAIRSQSPVLVHDLLAASPELPALDGYTVAPVALPTNTAARGDRRPAGCAEPSFGVRDLANPRPWTFLFDRWLQPALLEGPSARSDLSGWPLIPATTPSDSDASPHVGLPRHVGAPLVRPREAPGGVVRGRAWRGGACWGGAGSGRARRRRSRWGAPHPGDRAGRRRCTRT